MSKDFSTIPFIMGEVTQNILILSYFIRFVTRVIDHGVVYELFVLDCYYYILIIIVLESFTFILSVLTLT